MPTPAFTPLFDEDFLLLTTYRRTGAPVATAIWAARDGDDLVMFTPGDSGKVKRLRNNDRVLLQPCSRTGKVAADAPTVEARAQVLPGAADVQAATALLKRKYGLQFRLITAIEKIAFRRRAPRVALRVSEAS